MVLKDAQQDINRPSIQDVTLIKSDMKKPEGSATASVYSLSETVHLQII